MKNKFSKFINLQGKYLTSLLFVLLFGVGQMWGAWQTTTVDGTIGTRDSISTDGLTREWNFTPATQQVKPSTTAFSEYNDMLFKAGSADKLKSVAGSGWSCNSSSNIYIPVPAGSAGTITLSVYSASDSRYLQLYKTKDNTEGTSAQRLYSKENASGITSDGKKGPRSFSFTATDTTMINGVAYLHFKDNSTEMKINGFSIVLTTGSYPVASGPVDPTATFSNSDYTIGGTLDLSTLYTTNSEGAVTYSITDAGETGATLDTDGKTFSATTVGTATVQVNQTATSAHNAVEKTATITVKAAAAPDTEAPTLSSSVPANSATDVAVEGTIVLTFSEAIASVDDSKFLLSGATIGTVAIDGTDATKVNVPYSGAANEATVTLSVAAEAVADAAGNKSAALSDIAFTTVAAAAPVVCPNEGQVFYMEITSTASAVNVAAGATENLNTYGTFEGGSASITNGASETGKAYINNASKTVSINGNAAYITLNLDCPLKIGDQLTFVSGSGSNQICFTTDLTRSTTNITSSNKWTVPAAFNDVSTIYIWRNSSHTYIRSITITRPYNVTFVSDHGTAPTTPTKAVSFTLTELSDASFTHTGWTADKLVKVGGVDKAAGTTLGKTDVVTLTDNTTFTATWEAKVTKHTVTYYDGTTEPATVLGSELINEGSNPTGAGLAPKKQGFTFGGWSLTNGGAAIASYASVTVDENKDLFAVWTPVVCPISGTVFAFEMNESAKPGSEVKAPQKDILVIDEYLTITGQGSAIIGNTTNNTNQYASVKTDPKISLSGATGYLQIALECALQAGDVITIAKNNTQIYISDEVGTSGPTGNKYTTATNAENTIVVGANETTAAWVGAMNLYFWYKGGGVSITSVSVTRPAKHTLAWNFDGGNTTSTTHTAAGQVVEGAAITYPANNTMSKDGYTFSGWSTDVTEMPTSDLTITALWTAWPTMTLNAGEGSGDAIVTSVEPGSSVAVPACPGTFSKTDYNFNGWEYSPAVTMVDETHFTMPSENLTLTAQWVDANNVAQIGSTKYATFAAAIGAVADGETIQLLQDCSYSDYWTLEDKDVTVDLNGKHLSYTGTNYYGVVLSNAKLTVEDQTMTANPTIDMTANPLNASAITYTNSGKWTFTKAGVNVRTDGEMVVESGWMQTVECVACPMYNGIVTVNNGVLVATDNGVLMGNGTNGLGGYTINVHGGILLGMIQSPGYASMAIYHPNTGNLNIDGGILVSTNGPGVVCRGGESDITGGTIVAKGEGSGKCGDASLVLPAVGVAYDFKAAYPGVASFDATISGTANVSGEAGAVMGNYAGAEPIAEEEAAVAISGGTFNTPVAEALCADDYYPATKPSGKYGVTYAAESIDFEAFIDENGTGDAAKTLLASQLAAKHYDLSEALNTDHLDAPAGKPQDKGLKVKKTGLEIYFSVEPEKVLEIKTGNISGASIAINGGAAEDLTSTSIATHTYYNDNAQAVVLRMTKAGDKYNIFQSINIRNPYQVTLDATTNGGEAVAPMYGKMSVILPSATKGTDHFIGWYDRAEEEGRVLVGLADAEYTPTADVTLYAHFAPQSNDATLSLLEVDGDAVVIPGDNIYKTHVAYGTAEANLPKITNAVAHDAYVQSVEIYPTAGPEWNATLDGGCWLQQVIVTAEDGTTKGYYHVRTYVDPKDMACLIKATVTGDNAMAIDASASMFEGTPDIYKVYGNAETYESKSAPKFQGDGYLGVTLTTAGAAFQEGDVVRVFATKGIDNVAKLYVYSDNTGTAEKQIAESATALVLGYNEAALTSDGEGASSVYLCRAGQYTSWNPCIYDIAVYRAVPNPLVSAITFNGAAAVVDNDLKTITVEVPASTDFASMPVVATFFSNDPTQTTGAVTGSWAEGDNEYIVTDKDNDQTVYTVTITKAAAIKEVVISGTLAVLEDETTTLSAVVYDTNDQVASIQDVTWSVKAGDEALASVTSAGVVTGKAVGTAHIIATSVADNTKSAEVAVVVSENPCRAWSNPSSKETGATIGKMVVTPTGIGTLQENMTPYQGASATNAWKLDSKDTRYAEIKFTDNAQFESLLLGVSSKDNDKNYKFAVVCSSAAGDGFADGVLSTTTYEAVDQDEAENLVDVELPTGTKAVRVYRQYTNDFGGDKSVFLYYIRACKKDFVPVTAVNVSDANLAIGASLTLYATLTPANADIETYTWSIESMTATGVTIDGNVLTAAANATEGEVVVKVIATDVLSNSVNATATISIVNHFDAITPVTETTTWSWETLTVPSGNGPKIAENDTVLANYLSGAQWEKIAGKYNEYVWRSDSYKCYQGTKLNIVTTVPGVLTIKARRQDSGDKLYVNGDKIADLTTDQTTYSVAVPAGAVKITGTAGMRIYAMTFKTLDEVTPDYTRNVTIDRMGTVCVDHNVPAGCIVGAEVYQLLFWKYGTSYADCQMVDFEQVDEMEAGKPYMIIPTATVFELYYGAKEVNAPVNYNGFTGTFEAIAAAPDNVLVGKYGIVNNTIQKLGENCYSQANRAYIDLSQTISKEEYEANQGGAQPAPKKRVSLTHQGAQVTTGLDAINVNTEKVEKIMIEGQMYIIRGGHIFDATGRLVK